MSSPEPLLPETRERCGPSCQCDQVGPVRRVTAAEGMIKAEHRCENYGAVYLVVRRMIPTWVACGGARSFLAPMGKDHSATPVRPRHIKELARARNMPGIITMSESSPPPKETGERRCPHCRSADIMALGRVLADSTAIRSAYRCRVCATEFLLLSTERRVGPRGRRATD